MTLLPQLSVKEMMAQLLEANIIKQKDLNSLKNNQVQHVDPNLVMDIRHKKIKEKRQKRINEKNYGERIILLENNNKEQRTYNDVTRETEVNKQVENMIIDEEIKKCQKQFQIENRKIDKMILDIKQSGKEIKNKKISIKRKHNKKLKRNINQNTKEIDSNKELLLYSNTEVHSKDTNLNVIDKNPKSHFKMGDEKELNDFDEGLEKLSKLNISENNFKSIESSQDDDPSVDVDNLLMQMEDLQKSYEVLIHGKTYEATTSKQRQEISSEVNSTIHETSQQSGSLLCVNNKFKSVENNVNGYLYEQLVITENESIIICENPQLTMQNYNANDFVDFTDNDTSTGSRQTICPQKTLNKNNYKDDVIIFQDCLNKDKGKNKTNCSRFTLGFDKEKYLASKYFEKWKRSLLRKQNYKVLKQNTDLKQKEPYPSRNIVESKFEAFINKLQNRLSKRSNQNSDNSDGSREKLEDSSKINNYGEKFKNRFKAQKDIIEKQRKILQDQRTKIKMLENEEENKSKRAHTNSWKKGIEPNDNKIKSPKKVKMKKESVPSNESTPTFLDNMNKRAQDRKERWNRLKELKTLKEEEKIKQKLQEEEDRKRMMEEKKYADLQAEQMNYLRKILEDETRKTEAKNLERAEKKLSALNRKILLTRYLDLWKKLLMDRRHKMDRIKQIHDLYVKNKVIIYLKFNAEQNKIQRIQMAEAFRQCKLQKKYWTLWCKGWEEKKQTKQVAEDYNDFRLSSRALIGLLWNKQENKRVEDSLMLEAVAYHAKKLKMRAMQSLRNYPKIVFEEREKEKRLRSWEEKVKEILPDFSIT